eukprot:COSAG05_NODE_14330_length_400_cov_0.538206_1_plen_53_part_10
MEGALDAIEVSEKTKASKKAQQELYAMAKKDSAVYEMPQVHRFPYVFNMLGLS